MGFGFTRNVASSSRRRLGHSIEVEARNRRRIENVAIIGGGLAGLSTAYHLIDIAEKTRPNEQLHITIFDEKTVGKGGASSVAGGLLHPFSPRGKMIHFGQSALEHSKGLVQAAARHNPVCILRDHLYRIALSSKNVVELQDSAAKYGCLATWLSKEDLQHNFGIDCLGGLKLSNGCQVIHVPSYLEGLLEEIETKAKQLTSGQVKWEIMQPNDHREFNKKLKEYDSVILSAGSGLLNSHFIDDSLPIQLVRGQSIEIEMMAKETDETSFINNDAVLCGKYIAPLPSPTEGNKKSQRYVIGATHEFNNTPLTSTEVTEELRSRTYQLAPHLWDDGEVDKITSGVRMQSHRGKFGRMPIIGQYNSDTIESGLNHEHMWIFTGLSSRGLIYHGLFGRWLANAVLNDNEECLQNEFEDFDWWRRQKK
jgi:glycine/D-amino acid oxidase-like deaminating enzyme